LSPRSLATGGAAAVAPVEAAARSPARPAAPSVWPKQALLATSSTGKLLLWRPEEEEEEEPAFSLPPAVVLPRAAASAPSSMGSPRGVPVPWTATARTSRRGSEGEEELEELEAAKELKVTQAAPPPPPSASPRACLTSDACAGPLGAVSDAEAPPWLTAEPSSRASKGGREEEEEGEEEESSSPPLPPPPPPPLPTFLSTTTAKPSPRPYPSADASKLLHLPCGDSACSRQMRAVVPRSSCALTPPTTARVEEEEEEEEEMFPALSPLLLPLELKRQPFSPPSSTEPDDLSSRAARCAATRLEEHATSVATQAPPNPNANETRPARKERPCPVIAAAAPSAQPSGRRTESRYSEYMHPTKTPVVGCWGAQEEERRGELLLLLLFWRRSSSDDDDDEEEKKPPPLPPLPRHRSSSALVASSTPSSSSRACGSRVAASAGLIRNTEESKAARRSVEEREEELWLPPSASPPSLERNEPSLT